MNIWSDYKRIPLPDLLSFIVDNRGKTVPTADDGNHVLIATNCIRNENLYPSYEKVRLLSEETYQNWFRAHPVPGDIIFVCKGTPGRTCMVPDPIDFCIAQDMIALRANPALIYNRFLLVVLRSRSIQEQITNTSVGDVIPHFKKQFLDQLLIPVPPMEVQRKIGDLYFSLALKEELNKKINENLLQQAEALFKDRFLNTDPLSDGWKIQTLGDVSDMSAGGDKPKIISDSKTVECQYPIYSNGSSDEGLYGYTNDYKISEECVTVSARGTIGYVCLRHVPFTPIVRLVTLIPHKGTISAKYLYLWLKSIQIHGTGTTQQQLTVPDFRKTKIVIPSEESMTQFTETIDPLFQQIWAYQEQNAKLANIRDTLLPKLMSGELDVSDIDI